MTTVRDPRRRICGVCGRVLDYVEDQGWIHSLASTDPEELDHPAVPVLDTEVPVRDRCDFCYVDGTAYVIPVRDFEAIPGMSGSSGDWAACETCAGYIAKNMWNRLEQRVIPSWEERHGIAMPDEVLTSMRRLWRKMRKHTYGAVRKIEE